MWLRGALPRSVMCHAHLREDDQGDLWLYDTDGVLLGTVAGLRLARPVVTAEESPPTRDHELLHEVVWHKTGETAGLRPAAFLRDPGGCAPGPSNPTADETEGLEDLAGLYALRAVDELGWERREGATESLEILRRRLRVVSTCEGQFERLLQILETHGILERERGGDRWKVLTATGEPMPPSLARVASLSDDWGGLAGRLLHRVGPFVGEVLRGRRDARALLLEELPEPGPSDRLVAEAALSLASELPSGRQLRVLEVGGGLGNTARATLSALSGRDVDYVFTDVSSAHFPDIERLLAGFPCAYRVLDLERDPREQGFTPHAFDLVVAGEVFGALHGVGQAFAHCLRLLAPSGILVAAEDLETRASRALTFGLLENWVRSPAPPTEPSAWRDLLSTAGYAEISVVEHEPSTLLLGRAPAKVRPDRGLWLLCAPAKSAEPAAQLARALGEWNQIAVLAGAEAQSGREGALLEPSRRDSWQSLLEDLPRDPPLRGIVHLGGLGGRAPTTTTAELSEDVRGAAESAMALAQGIVDAGISPQLWLATRGAQAVAGEPCVGISGSPLWGFGRVVARELPYLRTRLVDLDPADEVWAERFAEELLFPNRENQIAHRGGERFVPRLERVGPPADPENAATGLGEPAAGVLRGRTCLIVGGLGGLGLTVATWLVERQVGAIVLNGRKPPGPLAVQTIAALRARGAEIRVELGDIADAMSAERIVRSIGGEASGLPPLGGVIHSAGVFWDGALTNHDWSRFEQILRPKVLGAWNLHQATLGLDLELFILFSTVASVIGNAGQSAYASANAFLDELARHRQALALPGQSIAWGPWSEVGASETNRAQMGGHLERIGVGWITPAEGLRAFGRFVENKDLTGLVVPVDWSLFTGAVDAPQPLVEDLLPPGTTRTGDGREAPGALLQRLRATPASERERPLLRFLEAEVSRTLRLSSPPSPRTGFFDLGMDSVSALDLRNRLNQVFAGVYVAPNTVALDYPSLAKLARHLNEELERVWGGEAEPSGEPQLAPDGTGDLSLDELAHLLAEIEDEDA